MRLVPLSDCLRDAKRPYRNKHQGRTTQNNIFYVILFRKLIIVHCNNQETQHGVLKDNMMI